MNNFRQSISKKKHLQDFQNIESGDFVWSAITVLLLLRFSRLTKNHKIVIWFCFNNNKKYCSGEMIQ